MNRHLIPLVLSTALCLASCFAAGKPNIILIFTDDHGYADLACQGFEKDTKTPHLDRLAREGARFTDGYVTAPQCCPSRAGLLTGRDQNRFGHIGNGYGPLDPGEKTLADHLGGAGYTTGMVGKWHLDPNPSDKAFLEKHGITNGKISPALQAPYHPHARGFRETFDGQIGSYSATYDLKGNRFEKPRPIQAKGDRLDIQSDAALRFIDLHHDKHFFLYLSYFAPHVPLASSKKHLDRFPGEMPERRRYALAMISAIDDGVGRIMGKIQQHGIDEKTLILFIGDNGAPLKLNMADDPLHLDGAYWNGSKNTPLSGEKGMLAEGGIRVPYLMRWKGTIPAGQVINTPVTTLDATATATAAAGIPQPARYDGEDLIPMLKGQSPLPGRTLHWRFWTQSAARQGNWKILKLGDSKTFLFNLAEDMGEKKDLAGQHPEIVRRLEASLIGWAKELKPAGLPDGKGNGQEQIFYRHHFGHPKP